MIQLYEILEQNDYYYVHPAYQINVQPDITVWQRMKEFASTIWNSIWGN